MNTFAVVTPVDVAIVTIPDDPLLLIVNVLFALVAPILTLTPAAPILNVPVTLVKILAIPVVTSVVKFIVPAGVLDNFNIFPETAPPSVAVSTDEVLVPIVTPVVVEPPTVIDDAEPNTILGVNTAILLI